MVSIFDWVGGLVDSMAEEDGLEVVKNCGISTIGVVLMEFDWVISFVASKSPGRLVWTFDDADVMGSGAGFVSRSRVFSLGNP